MIQATGMAFRENGSHFGGWHAEEYDSNFEVGRSGLLSQAGLLQIREY